MPPRLPDQREAAAFAGSLLMSGTKSHTRSQLQDEFRKLNAQVTASGGGGGAEAADAAVAAAAVRAAVAASPLPLPASPPRRRISWRR
jgi:hypothetical protein